MNQNLDQWWNVTKYSYSVLMVLIHQNMKRVCVCVGVLSLPPSLHLPLTPSLHLPLTQSLHLPLTPSLHLPLTPSSQASLDPLLFGSLYASVAAMPRLGSSRLPVGCGGGNLSSCLDQKASALVKHHNSCFVPNLFLLTPRTFGDVGVVPQSMRRSSNWSP